MLYVTNWIGVELLGKQYEDMTDKEKATYDKWMARSEKLSSTGKDMSKVGGKMMGCGCLATLLITIPIIILIFLIL